MLSLFDKEPTSNIYLKPKSVNITQTQHTTMLTQMNTDPFHSHCDSKRSDVLTCLKKCNQGHHTECYKSQFLFETCIEDVRRRFQKTKYPLWENHYNVFQSAR